MDWQTLIIKVAIGAVCALASGLISWLLLKLKTLVSSKVKNAKAKELLTAALDAIEAATKATQQTFVDNIKRTDRWTKEAQQVALTNAVNTAKAQMSDKVISYIQKNCGGDVDAWCKTQVEALLHDITTVCRRVGCATRDVGYLAVKRKPLAELVEQFKR